MRIWLSWPRLAQQRHGRDDPGEREPRDHPPAVLKSVQASCSLPQHGNQHGHAHGYAGLADHVDDRRPGGEGMRRKRSRRRGHHRGQRQAHSGSGQQHAPDDSRGVVRDAGHGQRPPGRPGREDEAAQADHQCGAVAADETPGHQERQQRHHQRTRGDAQPGPERRPVPRVLLPQHDGQQHGAERGGEEHGDDRSAGELPGPEQIRVHQRCTAAAAVQHKQSQQDDSGGENHLDRSGIPPPVGPLDQAEGEQPDPGGGKDDTDRVGPLNVVSWDGRKAAPANYQGDETYRHVDQENPSPAGRHQQAADHRADRRGQAAHRGPSAYRTLTALRLIRGEHQAEGCWGEQGCPARLDQAESDQHADAR